MGCSSGALAREYKKVNATCHYLGIEIDAAYAKLAERYCDAVAVLDIEKATEANRHQVGKASIRPTIPNQRDEHNDRQGSNEA